MVTLRRAYAIQTIVLVGLLPLVVSHGNGGEAEDGSAIPEGIKMTLPHDPNNMEATSFKPSYYRYGEYQAWIWSHIVTMAIAWCFILPIGKSCNCYPSLTGKADGVSRHVFHCKVKIYTSSAGSVFNREHRRSCSGRDLSRQCS